MTLTRTATRRYWKQCRRGSEPAASLLPTTHCGTRGCLIRKSLRTKQSARLTRNYSARRSFTRRSYPFGMACRSRSGYDQFGREQLQEGCDRMRIDGRDASQLRPTRITSDYLVTAEGSVLIEAGNTRVLCAATIEDSVPGFLRGTGKGWVTAEYSMLPRATVTRTPREVTKGRPSG